MVLHLGGSKVGVAGPDASPGFYGPANARATRTAVDGHEHVCGQDVAAVAAGMIGWHGRESLVSVALGEGELFSGVSIESRFCWREPGWYCHVGERNRWVELR